MNAPPRGPPHSPVRRPLHSDDDKFVDGVGASPLWLCWVVLGVQGLQGLQGQDPKVLGVVRWKGLQTCM